MSKDIKKIRKLLRSIDEKYEKDPSIPKKAEEYRRKYSELTEEDLLKIFTI